MSVEISFDAVIVGAGFSDTMVTVHLAEIATQLRVLLVNGNGAFAREVTYGTYSKQHLLNVPAGKMSAFPDDRAGVPKRFPASVGE